MSYGQKQYEAFGSPIESLYVTLIRSFDHASHEPMSQLLVETRLVETASSSNLGQKKGLCKISDWGFHQNV